MLFFMFLWAVFGANAGGQDQELLDTYNFLQENAVGPLKEGYSFAMTSEPLGFFLRSLNFTSGFEGSAALPINLPSYLDGLVHYRLIPGKFPKGMGFHFDGLATVLKFTISDGEISWIARPFESTAFVNYTHCLFLGSGTGPNLSGLSPCLRNPGVNLLPIDGQLWLTIDTSLWGRVDMNTLETLAAKPNVASTVLNAHPACDREFDDGAGICYVQHNCNKNMNPLGKEACFSILVPGATDLGVEEAGRATLPKSKLIQHSHSPCLTPNYVVSKIDAFEMRNPLNRNAGLLKFVHQSEDNLWLVMRRDTNETRVLQGGAKFVNNHAWNCYEDKASGSIVVEVVAATEDYLDNYFERNLASKPDWANLFHEPLRCHLSFESKNATCAPLLPKYPGLVFDYPTFNPLYKLSPDYQYFYAIAPRSPETSVWFDRLIKVDVKAGTVAATWEADNVYLTEFDFVPAANSAGDRGKEDAGSLVSVLYNATADTSMIGIFDAESLLPRAIVPLGQVVPFHAHGIVCPNGAAKPCFTNP